MSEDNELAPLLRMILERMQSFTDTSLAKDRSVRQLNAVAQTMHERIRLNHQASYQRYQELAAIKGLPLMACKQGCAWCCHQCVAATVPEAIAIVTWIHEKFGPAQREDLRVRLAEHRDARKAWVERRDGSEFRQTCAFLKNNACTIHSVRPAACRGFNSLDVNECIHNYEHPEDMRPVETFHLHWLIAMQIRWGLKNGLGLQDMANGIYELVGLVSDLLERPETASHYLQGDDPFIEHALSDTED